MTALFFVWFISIFSHLKGQNLPCQQFVIPCYESPGDNSWNALYGIEGYLILNPDSGPGPAKDSAWVAVSSKAQSAGTGVIGYVHTSYGKRASSAVESEVDKFYEWYNVNGIFFDEAAETTAEIPYYQDLYKYVKAKSSRNNYVIINPGVVPNIGYERGCADTIVVYEQSVNNYNSWNPSWTQNASIPVNISHMVYGIQSQTQMQSVIDTSRKRNAKFIFICQDDRYNSLPSYWSDEKTYVKNECK